MIDLTVSIAPCAADFAEERPRAWMIAAPRCCTAFMKSFSSHCESEITSEAALPSMRALKKSG